MSYDIDEITREDVALIIGVMLFSFFMGLIIGKDSLGITLLIGMTAYILIYVGRILRIL
jgi:hypothetical protein|tara:strand:- start:1048 stop:1224 length:177 start_codon:yes stop_codon:yes gene_type:complete